MAQTLDILEEPAGKIYEGLLRLAAEKCKSFSLVWRDQLVFQDSATDVAAALEPFLVHEDRTNEWPGTALVGHQATVRHYRMAGPAVSVLARAQRLYAWCSPALPEDLACYTSDGSVWLASISHEKDAWFEGGPELEAILRVRLPGLVFSRTAER